MPRIAQGLGGPRAAEPDLTDLSRPLRELLRAAAGTRAQVAGVARARGVELLGDMVKVVVVFRSPADAAQADLTPYGGQVHIRRDRRVQALVPVGSLAAIAQLPQVATVRQPYYPVTWQLPTQGAPVSEGVQLTNASAFMLQSPPIGGAGVTVNVVDIGFLGYPQRQAEGNLPPTVGTFDFAVPPPAGGLDSVNVHGTGCAEIVHDMAPGASINLIRALTELELEQAVAFAIGGGAPVVTMSVGFLTGPFDGTSPLSQIASQAPGNGVLLTAAAANSAQQHWEGAFRDTDGDGLQEFAAGDEGITVNLSGGTIQAYLSWWKTGGLTTAQDYDLVLRDGTGVEVARSAVTQDGDDEPSEILFASVAPGVYELLIHAYRINRTQVDYLELYTYGTDLEPAHQVATSSLCVPADAQGAFTVGATRGVAGIPDGLSIDALELFSSQGPTDDGRMKPDLASPDYVSTASYGPVSFPGTSSATPHVAGAAALLKSEDLTRDLTALRAFLIGLAKDLGTPGRDNQFGYGRLSLRVGLTDPPPADKVPPVIAILSPTNGAIVGSRQPTITGSLQDDASGIDESTIVLNIDGTPQVLAPGDFNAATGVLTFTPPVELTLGAHVVTLTADDLDGNQGNTATVGFRIALPVIGAGLRMVSLPYTNLGTSDPSVVLGRPLSEIAVARWLADDTAFNKYHIYPDPYASFQPPDTGPFAADPTVLSPPAGLGYFMRFNADLPVDISGDPVSSSQPYVIKLRRGTAAPLGWNMIGTPFNAPVSVATAEFVSGGVTYTLAGAVAAGLTNGVLYTFEPDQFGGGFYSFTDPMAGVLQPLAAYWINVASDVDMRIFPVVVGPAQAGPSTRAAADGWRIQLSASAAGHQDPMNFAGVSASGSVGPDAGDI
ncbi:MAG: S8 family serine peptidase, partial [Armatimonadota bacterium]